MGSRGHFFQLEIRKKWGHLDEVLELCDLRRKLRKLGNTMMKQVNYANKQIRTRRKLERSAKSEQRPIGVRRVEDD